MKSLQLFFLFTLIPFFLAGQTFDLKTESNRYARGENNMLIIDFNLGVVPSGFAYDISQVYARLGDGRRVLLKTFSGNTKDLLGNTNYQIKWSVLTDLEEFESRGVKFEFELKYNAATQIEKKKQDDERARQLRVQEQERLEIAKKQADEQRKAEEEARQRQNRNERRSRKPFALVISGGGGYLGGTLENHDVSIVPEVGYGYNGMVNFDIRIIRDEPFYLQLGAGYNHRVFAFSSTATATYWDRGNVVFDIDRAELAFTDYRGYLGVKSGTFVVGGYYAMMQSVVRKKELIYTINDRSTGRVIQSYQELNENVELLEADLIDGTGKSPVKDFDFGVTAGFESNTNQRFLYGIYLDYSLQNIYNNNYEGKWQNNTSILLESIFPPEEVKLSLLYAYVKVGIRF